jgi:hypothetical protein
MKEIMDPNIEHQSLPVGCKQKGKRKPQRAPQIHELAPCKDEVSEAHVHTMQQADTRGKVLYS